MRRVFRAFFDRHPWYYRSVFYAVGFSLLTLLISGDSVAWAVAGGVLFSVFMTALDLLWVLPRRGNRGD
jgi:hypothetical protein